MGRNVPGRRPRHRTGWERFFDGPCDSRAVIIALTGTPGTGKSTAGEVLRRNGRTVIELGDLIRERAVPCTVDPERGSLEVDPDVLDEEVRKALPEGDVILVGHLSHLLTVDLIVVLRCRPSVLASRLRARGWPEAKVLENVEAEACDVILVESAEASEEVCEIDTTGMTPEEVAGAVLEIMSGEREKYAIGNVDWSEEVLGWF